MPISHLGPLVRVVAAAPVAMSLVLAGCGKSEPPAPNVDQIGHTMQTQVYKLLFATSTTNPQITDALFDKYTSCGNGTVKLTYAVSGKATTFATGSAISRNETKTHATPTQVIDDLVRFMPELGTFKIVARADQGTTVKLVNAATHTRLTLHSPGRDMLQISSETDCLKAGNLGHDIG
jgi:hypothetical protein